MANLTGPGPEQAPLNSMLGSMAWQNADRYLKLKVEAQAASFTPVKNTIYFVSTAAARTVTMPTGWLPGDCFWIKDSTNQANVNNITLTRAGSESIDAVAANKTLSTAGGSWLVVFDGTNWFTL